MLYFIFGMTMNMDIAIKLLDLQSIFQKLDGSRIIKNIYKFNLNVHKMPHKSEASLLKSINTSLEFIILFKINPI